MRRKIHTLDCTLTTQYTRFDQLTIDDDYTATGFKRVEVVLLKRTLLDRVSMLIARLSQCMKPQDKVNKLAALNCLCLRS